MNIWEHNDLSKIKVDFFGDTKVYWMDNFYKYPDLVHKELVDPPPPLWKHGGTWDPREYENSKNTVHFEDRRWDRVKKEGLEVVYDNLSRLFGQRSLDHGLLVSNYTKFFSDEKSLEYNNYKDNYWWPHTDLGYNAIVYFNKSDDGSEVGTNLYEFVGEYQYNNLYEHDDTWVSKKDWELIGSFKAKYNRLVAFDGKQYWHGMSINDDRWIHEARVNQVMFFSGLNLV